ncbi:MAG: Lrp/AsnC family transcriptional regulator [Candidatus Dormibacteria bacterium]
MSYQALDETDLRILEALGRDPRVPMSRLARAIRMSPPATTERVRRLEQLGVISGYRMEVSPEAVGLPITAFVRIRPAPGQLPQIAELAKATREVVECHRITGEDCFLIKVHSTAIEALEGILDRFLALGQTTTSIVQSSPVPGRPPPLEHLRQRQPPRRRNHPAPDR